MHFEGKAVWFADFLQIDEYAALVAYAACRTGSFGLPVHHGKAVVSAGTGGR